MSTTDPETAISQPSPSETTPLLYPTTPPPPPTPSIFTPRLLLILSSTYLGTFLGAIDSTVIATLSTSISSEFSSMRLFSWLATAYLLSNAACQPISGRLTDIFGRGPGLVFSNLVFSLGNLICSLAHDEWTIIVGRVIAGIGGGGLMSIGTFLASDLVPLRQRGVVQGFGNVCYGAGAMLGGVLGGWIAENTASGWRLVFLAQVPFTLVSAGLVAVLVDVPPKIPAGEEGRGYLKRIDFGGVFLTVAFLVTLLLGLNSGGNLVPWTHWIPLTTIPASLVLLIVLLYIELHAPQPIVPVRLLLRRTVAAACVANLTIIISMLALLFYIPMYLQVRGFSATEAGGVLLYSSVGVSICSLGSGVIMQRTGQYLRLGVAVTGMFLAGAGVVVRFGEETALWWVKGAFVALGGGYGAMLTVTLLACISAVDHDDQAVITSATYLFRSLGSTLGITIASVVFQNILHSQLHSVFSSEPNADRIIEHIVKSIENLRTLPVEWQERVVGAYMEAFHGVWITVFAISAVGLVAICLMKENHLHSTLDRRVE